MTLIYNDLGAGVQGNSAVAPVSHPHSRPEGRALYRAYFKRALDLALVILSAPISIPLIAVFALLVAMDGNRPFYSQLRVGRNGQHFRIWKLRTMVPDADKFLEMYLATNPVARLEWDTTQKLKNDPRVTRVGAVLRKLSLDELPQLLNVFNGTMSVVGPRPMMVSQKVLYTGRAYYELRPGITGLWQVSDRNEGEFAGRAIYDDLYDRTLSLGTDLRVLMRTVLVVLRATGY